MIDAMYKRHTVRKYLDKNLPDSFIDVINERIEENNQKYFLDQYLSIALSPKVFIKYEAYYKGFLCNTIILKAFSM